MIKNNYSCDCGCIAIKCGESIINFHNGYGDGYFKVYVMENDEEFWNYKEEHFEKYGMQLNQYRYITSCLFNKAQVLEYDCLQVDKITEENVLFELNGDYAIYNNNGKIYFVKW